MLLARYALAIIDSERICTRRYIQQVQCSAPEQLCERAHRLIAFAETRQKVRFDDCLLPALRSAAALADDDSTAGRRAVDDIVELAELGGAMLPGLRSCLRYPGAASLPSFLNAYCGNLAARLACEEETLLPLACHLLSAEAWFHVGAAFLRHDEKTGVSNFGISAKVH
ncbi:MAG: hypothetical protein M3Y65_19590 [Pseudomonadota bacterium]|nr:hypothetical protein [Pseudomonadota bacterium]